jgi:glycosyltransferase involved in cell wall biosynthesis
MNGQEIRILYAVTAAAWGGAPQHVLDLVAYMRSHGHTVGVVAAPEPRLMRDLQRLGATFFPNPHFVLSFAPHRDILAIPPVLQAIMHFRPDLIHAHSTKAGLAARLAAALTRRPVIFTAHGWGFAEARAWWLPPTLLRLERLAARATARIICVSGFDYELALRYRVGRPEQLTIIRNGIAPEPYLAARERARGDERREDEPVLITVGRLAPPKDPFTLLEAFQRLSRGRLLVVGDGPLRPQVEAFLRSSPVGDRVRLLGEREDVPDLLAAADLFLLSSHKEGLPRAIIEAMMVGLPVVATRVGGVPELVEHRRTGLLVSPGDPQALAQALQTLIEDPALARQMGIAGQQKALREFTLDQMCARTYRVYQEVLHQTTRSVIPSGEKPPIGR